MDRVKFAHMSDGDVEGYVFLRKHEIDCTGQVGTRLFEATADLATSCSGYQVSRPGHALQTAARAWYDGSDIDCVVSAERSADHELLAS